MLLLPCVPALQLRASHLKSRALQPALQPLKDLLSHALSSLTVPYVLHQVILGTTVAATSTSTWQHHDQLSNTWRLTERLSLPAHTTGPGRCLAPCMLTPPVLLWLPQGAARESHVSQLQQLGNWCLFEVHQLVSLQVAVATDNWLPVVTSQQQPASCDLWCKSTWHASGQVSCHAPRHV
jgi:hypothetical protein